MSTLELGTKPGVEPYKAFVTESTTGEEISILYVTDSSSYGRLRVGSKVFGISIASEEVVSLSETLAKISAFSPADFMIFTKSLELSAKESWRFSEIYRLVIDVREKNLMDLRECAKIARDIAEFIEKRLTWGKKDLPQARPDEREKEIARANRKMREQLKVLDEEIWALGAPAKGLDSSSRKVVDSLTETMNHLYLAMLNLKPFESLLPSPSLPSDEKKEEPSE